MQLKIDKSLHFIDTENISSLVIILQFPQFLISHNRSSHFNIDHIFFVCILIKCTNNLPVRTMEVTRAGKNDGMSYGKD